MSYEIVESKLVFQDGKLVFIICLWRSGGSFRATSYPVNEEGRMQKHNTISHDCSNGVTWEALQEVAGFGTYLTDDQKKRNFPNIKNWNR